jgi:transcriptional regulator with XRE-family HTH domain
MNCAGSKKTKQNRLDLVRRARLLGVTHGHLSRVLSGKRGSNGLLLRMEALLDAEAITATNFKTKSRLK